MTSSHRSIIALFSLVGLAPLSQAATTFNIADYTGFASGDAERISDNVPLTGFSNSGPFGSVAADGGGGTTSGGIGDGLNVVATLLVDIDISTIASTADGFLVDIFALATFDTANYSGSVSSSINLSTSVVFGGTAPMPAFIGRTGTLGDDDAGAVTFSTALGQPLGPGAVMIMPGETYFLSISTFITAGGPFAGGNDSIIGGFSLTIPAPGSGLAGLGLAFATLSRRRRR